MKAIEDFNKTARRLGMGAYTETLEQRADEVALVLLQLIEKWAEEGSYSYCDQLIDLFDRFMSVKKHHFSSST